MQFVPYPKTPRLKRSVVFTEKIDGTNAQVVITRLGEKPWNLENVIATQYRDDETDNRNVWVMRVGSRNRWITPGKATDNYGFAQWCQENAYSLFELGEGQHFGEWYGQGIGRGYGLTERRFALFNTARWGKHNPKTPWCCEAVPVLHVGDFGDTDGITEMLREVGSVAVPGFMDPEGLIAFHTASSSVFKVLLENDDKPKGLS